MIAAKKAMGVPEVFHVAGRGALEVTFEEEGQRDLETFMPLILGVIVVILYLTYRSLRGVFLLSALMFRSWTAGLINVLPISLVMLFSFGLLGLLNIPLEVGKAFAASIVIGVGIDYTIHFLNKYRVNVRAGQTDPEQITVATMTTSGKAIFFNALVVIGGFLVFLSSHFRPNFYLGAMMALNMGACLLVSMTVLPAMLNRFRPRFVFGPDGPDVRQDQVRTQQE